MHTSYLKRFLFAVLAIVSAVALHGAIGASLQIQLGNPSSSTADPANHSNYLIQRAQYAMDYNDLNGTPNWVSWNLTTADQGSAPRSNFLQDTTLPAGFYQVKTTDYSGSGYDRGHLCPSADRTVTVADNQVTFYMTNMMPQAPDNNQGVWANFESFCRTEANAGNELLITAGPSGFSGSRLPSSAAAIPLHTWKIVVVVPTGAGLAIDRITSNTRVIALKIPNTAGVRTTPWQNFITSTAQIEADTGFTFFTALPAPLAAILRAKIDGQANPVPPTIVTQPQPQSAPLGGSASFSVTATGDAPLTYQWFRNSTTLGGATGSTLGFTNIQTFDFANYDVLVSNAVGSVLTNTVALTQSTGTVPPAITTHPVSQATVIGGSATFTVAAAGDGPMTYQWFKNSASISGATSPSLSFPSAQTTDAGTFHAVATNPYGSASSNPATLTVNPPSSGSTVVWNFTTASPTSGLPSGVTGGTVSQNNNNGTTTMLTTTSASSGYTGATGGNNAGAAARTGALNQAAGGSAYFALTLAPSAGVQLVVEGINFGSRSTSTGPQTFAVYTSVDNYTAPVASGTLAATSTWTLMAPALATTTGAAGAAVTVRIYGYNGSGSASANTANWRIDDLNLTVSTIVPTPPTITTQPLSQAVSEGSNVSFTVGASGPGPLSYQWRKNSANITGNASASTATLSLSPAGLGDAGNYDCVVSNAGGSATSAVATLTVNAAPASIVTWNFTTASPAGGLPVGVTGGTMTQNNNNGTTTMLTTTSASSGYSGATGGNNAGAAARTGSLVPGTNGSAYFQFTLTPPTGNRIKATAINFGSRSTSTGPRAFAVYTSVDNYAAPVATGSLAATSTWTLMAPTLTTTTGATSTPVTVRIYGYNGSGSASANIANWRIDDLKFTVQVQ